MVVMQTKVAPTERFAGLGHTSIIVRRLDRHQANDRAVKLNVKEYKKAGKSVPMTKIWAIFLKFSFQKIRASSSKLPVTR